MIRHLYKPNTNVILIGLELLHFIVLVIWLRSRLNAKYQGAVRTGKRMSYAELISTNFEFPAFIICIWR